MHNHVITHPREEPILADLRVCRERQLHVMEKVRRGAKKRVRVQAKEAGRWGAGECCRMMGAPLMSTRRRRLEEIEISH